jgi:hypothetical protein
MIPNQDDFTNGLSFWKWLITCNKVFMFFVMPIACLMLIAGFIWQSQLAIGIIISFLVIYYFLLRWEYKKAKKGEAM